MWISSVFASPGTPTIRLLPPANSDSSTCSIDVVLPDDQLAELGDDLVAAGLHPVGERDVVRRLQVHDFLRNTIHTASLSLTIQASGFGFRLWACLAALALAPDLSPTSDSDS